MRIADKMSFEQVKSNLAKNRTEMAELQNQAATQKRVTKPSDDPLAATRVLSARTEIAGNQQFLKSVSQAKTFLEYSDQSLGELADLVIRAKELALSQASDASADRNTRRVTASEVEQLFSQAVQIGNRKIGDRFLFGGFKTTRPPFDPNGKYKGDDGEMKISINKEATIALNIPGSRVFLGKDVRIPYSANAGPQDPNDSANQELEVRGPASRPPNLPLNASEESPDIGMSWKSSGVNVFKILQDFQTGLLANDKNSIQESLDLLDEALAQVVLARSAMGSRVMTLNSGMETLQKGQVDAKALASNLEEADTFELVSDLNKTESTLKASLETSGKLIQPSLLDFLR